MHAAAVTHSYKHIKISTAHTQTQLRTHAQKKRNAATYNATFKRKGSSAVTAHTQKVAHAQMNMEQLSQAGGSNMMQPLHTCTEKKGQ
jgi:hypothetical protein